MTYAREAVDWSAIGAVVKGAVVKRGGRSERALDIGKLRAAVDEALVGIIMKHLARQEISGSGDLVTCRNVGQARERFSAARATDGMTVFASARNEEAGPIAVVPLETLFRMLQEARSAQSIVAALAPTKDMPAASEIEVGSPAGADWSDLRL